MTSAWIERQNSVSKFIQDGKNQKMLIADGQTWFPSFSIRSYGLDPFLRDNKRKSGGTSGEFISVVHGEISVHGEMETVEEFIDDEAKDP